EKRLRIARVAQGAGGDHAHCVGDNLLRRAMKPAQNFHGFGHRFRREKSGAEDAFAQASDFAVFVDRAEASCLQSRNFKANGVRSDIDRGERGHEEGDSLHAGWEESHGGFSAGAKAPQFIFCALRGAEAPLFHGSAGGCEHAEFNAVVGSVRALPGWTAEGGCPHINSLSTWPVEAAQQLSRLFYAAESLRCAGGFIPGLRGRSGAGTGFGVGKADAAAATAWRNFPRVTLFTAATSADSRRSPKRSLAAWVKVSQSCQLPRVSCSRLSSAINWPASTDLGANSAA